MLHVDMEARRSIFAPKTSLLPRPSGSQGKRYDNKIVINVGGVRFETYKTTLKNIPDTRLSWLTDTKGNNPDYDPVNEEYFFDRHPGLFQMVLNYYRTGKLHTPMEVCGPAFEEELAYWGIDETQIEPCCWNTYRTHRDAQETLAEFDQDDSDSDAGYEEEVAIRKRFGISEDFTEEKKSLWARWRPRLWRFLDDPKANKASRVFDIISVAFIIASIAVFCMETHVLFRYSLSPNITLSSLSVADAQRLSRPLPFLIILEYIIISFFTFELISRISVCPSKKAFLKEPFNWVDIFSVVPFFVIIILEIAISNFESTPLFRVLNALRLIRIFRIFKLTRHFSGLKILSHTIKASARELLLLSLVLVIGVLIFAVLIYYAEQVDEASKNDFKDIPIGFWWAVVTMTTLGYGDTYPRTALGYIIGTICAICGLLMLSLPVPVVVSNFTLYYSHAQAKLKLPKKSKNVMVGAASALKEDILTTNSIPEEDDSGTVTGSELSVKTVTGSRNSLKSLERKESEDSAIGCSETASPSSCKSSSPKEIRAPPPISVIFTDELSQDHSTLTRRGSSTSLPSSDQLLSNGRDKGKLLKAYSVQTPPGDSNGNHWRNKRRGSLRPAGSVKRKSLTNIDV